MVGSCSCLELWMGISGRFFSIQGLLSRIRRGGEDDGAKDFCDGLWLGEILVSSSRLFLIWDREKGGGG